MQRTRVPWTGGMVTLLVPLLCNACGLLLTHGPPAGHTSLKRFGCTTSAGGPALDAVAATVSIAFALKTAADEPEYDSHASNDDLVAGILRVAIWGVSAAVGFDKVEKCVAAQHQLAERLGRMPASGGAATVAYGPAVQRVESTPGSDTLVAGERVQIVAQAFAPSGGVFLGKRIRWSSSNDSIAVVSDSGLVTARAQGTVLIAANVDNVIGIANVMVAPAR